MIAEKDYKLVFIIAAVVAVCLIVASKLLKPTGSSMKGNFVYRGGSTLKSDYYSWITPIVKAVGAEYGLPWQAMAAQTALETGYGRSSLVQKYNNFGGIKDTDGKNSTAPMATKEFLNGKWVTIQDGFEIYPTPYEGLIAYAQFFHKNKRYAKALNYPNDPVNFIKEVRKAGYATDPNYVAKLVPMINEANKYA